MEDVDLPDNVLEGANYVRLDLLPEKYKILYEKEYSLLLCQWRLSKEYFPYSLWPKYSMLRACLVLKGRVEIDKYGTLD
jgi:hypothetical protein